MPTTVEETEKVETGENPKDELILNSLEIKGYRCFEHLTIEKLGRVNLIVGKNNVGKTALLEGLLIYSEMRNNLRLSDILLTRNEISQRVEEEGFYQPNDFDNYRHLFFDRPFPVFSPEDDLLNAISFEIGSGKDANKTLYVEFGKGDKHSPASLKPSFPERLPNYKTSFIRSNGLINQDITKLWESVQLRESEDFVIKALLPLKENLVSVRLIEYPLGSNDKVPVARIKKEKFEIGENPSADRLLRIHKVIDDFEPVPLKSLGEGMTRLFGLALTLVNCRNGMLLIDEIESGLHYSALPDVWKLIFKTARDLNVQVFATTHSYDCIQAFAEAAIDDEESEGNLIRLARNEEQIKAFTFDEKQLETITKEKIEVR